MPPTTKVTITLSGNQLRVDQDPAEIVERGKIKWVKSAGILDFRILPPANLFDLSSLPHGYSWNNIPVKLLPSITAGHEYEYLIEYTTSKGKDTLDPKIAIKPPTKFFFDFEIIAPTILIAAAIILGFVYIRSLKMARIVNSKDN